MEEINEKHICYMCGAEAKFQLKNGKWCCHPSVNSCPERIKKTKYGVRAYWQTIKELGYTPQTRKDIKKENSFSKKEKEERRQLFETDKSSCKCDFCQAPANFILKNGKYCCEASSNKCPVVRQKNSERLKKSYKEGRRAASNLFAGPQGDLLRARSAQKHYSLSKEYVLSHKEEIFRDYSGEKCGTSFIRSYLLRYIISVPCCAVCGLSTWNDQPITLELHHINNNHMDNRLENLQLLCPNCHSQTDNWRSSKDSKSPSKTDEEYLEALETHSSIRSALESLGLTSAESNYIRARRLLETYNSRVGRKLFGEEGSLR